MIKNEILADGKLIRHYSNSQDMMLLQTDTGLMYDEAIDITPTNHTYEEAPRDGRHSEDLTDTERIAKIETEIAEIKTNTEENTLAIADFLYGGI